MAREWKKLSLRLAPEVHYTIMQLSPNPTKAIRHLINLWASSLARARFQDHVPQEFQIDVEALKKEDDRD